jgi:hypothetical protein
MAQYYLIMSRRKEAKRLSAPQSPLSPQSPPTYRACP